jgi:hypothetical protein
MTSADMRNSSTRCSSVTTAARSRSVALIATSSPAAALQPAQSPRCCWIATRWSIVSSPS